jgi:SPP1 family predicted phage head-tail adaptor
MRAGELRSRITIQQKNVTQNSLGEEVITWETLATVWAKVIAMSGAEAMGQGLASATTIYQVTIRGRDDVTSAMRVLYEGLTLEILAVLDSTDPVDQTQLDCKQIV